MPYEGDGLPYFDQTGGYAANPYQTQAPQQQVAQPRPPPRNIQPPGQRPQPSAQPPPQTGANAPLMPLSAALGSPLMQGVSQQLPPWGGPAQGPVQGQMGQLMAWIQKLMHGIQTPQPQRPTPQSPIAPENFPPTAGGKKPKVAQYGGPTGFVPGPQVPDNQYNPYQ